jgi:hypothetical protein
MPLEGQARRAWNTGTHQADREHWRAIESRLTEIRSLYQARYPAQRAGCGVYPHLLVWATRKHSAIAEDMRMQAQVQRWRANKCPLNKKER